MATTLEYLRYVADAYTGTTLYTFARAVAMDMSFKRPSATFVVPGVDGGQNPRPGQPNPMAPRTLPFKFWYAYAPGETYNQAKSTLLKAIGNRALLLYVQYPDGTTRRNSGALTDFNDPITINNALTMVEFSMTFALDQPYWKSTVPANAFLYDKTTYYDTGVNYDLALSLPLGAATQNLTVTNNGDAPEYGGRYSIYGPFDGPITVLNNTIPIASTYEQFVYAGNLATGDQLTVDSGINLVLKNGVPDWGNFSYGNTLGYAQREWMRIDPGANVLTVSHPSGAIGGRFIPDIYDAYH